MVLLFAKFPSSFQSWIFQSVGAHAWFAPTPVLNLIQHYAIKTYGRVDV
jgi:hypothetical protein